jgi:hypothetical protein
LFASVAPDVKTISDGRHPIRDATASRARSTASAASRPAAWVDAAFANRSVNHGSIASSTLGATLVVALASR